MVKSACAAYALQHNQWHGQLLSKSDSVCDKKLKVIVILIFSSKFCNWTTCVDLGRPQVGLPGPRDVP